jgi:hypothetical protein
VACGQLLICITFKEAVKLSTLTLLSEDPGAHWKRRCARQCGCRCRCVTDAMASRARSQLRSRRLSSSSRTEQRSASMRRLRWSPHRCDDYEPQGLSRGVSDVAVCLRSDLISDRRTLRQGCPSLSAWCGSQTSPTYGYVWETACAAPVP